MSRFYTQTQLSVNGEVAEAEELNNVNIGTDTGFTLVAAELDVQLAVVAAEVEAARKWAEELENVPVAPGAFSAKHWATKAAASAVLTAADRVQTGLDRVATGQDKVATAADRVQTGLDRTQTGLDRVATGQDKVATAADRVQTGLDKTATAADRVQTGLDKTATAADRVQTGLDKVATAADRVQTGLDRASATSSEATATTQAGIATTKAGEALVSANAAAASAAVIPMPTAADIGSVLTATGASTNTYLPARSRKNYIIDGNFDIWREATTQADSGYGSDTMWYNHTTTARSVTRQAFTPGQTEVPNNPRYYSRMAVTTGTTVPIIYKRQSIEHVNSLAGKVATLSFWARCTSGAGRTMAISITQNFGTTGSPSTSVTTSIATVGIGTAWQKHTLTFNVPSISSKVLGDEGNDRLDLVFTYGYLTTVANLFDIAQVQLEEGSIATEFERMTVGETSRLVDRYYQQIVGFTAIVVTYAATFARANTFSFPEMRNSPAVTEVSAPIFLGHLGTPGTIVQYYQRFNSFAPSWNWTTGTVGRAFVVTGVGNELNYKLDARL